jgi:YD repeat-containing protein
LRKRIVQYVHLKQGLPTTLTDRNNNVTRYAYDQFGRVATLTGLYEQGGATPTMHFEYHPEAVVAWALTRHFDSFRDASGADTLDTVTFVDGLPRVIQTKTDATLHSGPDMGVNDVMVVSGRQKFDFLGRTVEQFYPRTEPLGTPGVFNAVFDDEAQPTRTQLDVLD